MNDHHERSLKQEVYDFSTVRETILVTDPNSPYLAQLEGWALVLAHYNASPKNWHLAVVDDFGPIAEWVIKLVSAMNRPLMLERFQGYARLVLSEEQFALSVTAPQVIYDFDQFYDRAHSDALHEEIMSLREMVMIGGKLTEMSDLSPEMIKFMKKFFEGRDRPNLRQRLAIYIDLLMPGDSFDGEAESDTPQILVIDDDAGGLSANLLLPGPAS